MKKVFVLTLIAVLFLTSCTEPKEKADIKDSAVQVGTSVGNKAPDFTLKNLKGKDVKLSDYKGKIVIVNFFGVWCPWCRLELPGFINAYKDFKSKGVELLVVDSGDTTTKLQSYLEENKFDIDPVIDSEGQVTDIYKVNSFPTSYIINAEGIIQKVHTGFMDENTLRSILNNVLESRR